MSFASFISISLTTVLYASALGCGLGTNTATIPNVGDECDFHTGEAACASTVECSVPGACCETNGSGDGCLSICEPCCLESMGPFAPGTQALACQPIQIQRPGADGGV